MKRPRLLAAALPLALCGCLGVRTQAPPEATVVVPASRRGEVGPAAPPEADWWRAFGDPVMSDVVERALAHNRDIAQAAARVAQARAAERQARGERGPELDGFNEGGRIRTLEVVGPVTTNADRPKFNISWDLDLFRKLAQTDAAARSSYLATAAARDAVRLSVAGTAASGYINLLGLDARLKVAQDTLKTRADSLRPARPTPTG